MPATQVSTVQGFLSSQPAPLTLQAPPEQVPAAQSLLSKQLAVLLATLQPDLASQLSVVHRLPSSQTVALPPLQRPPLHTSFWVQASPSSQDAVFAPLTQPDVLLQLSAVQTLPSSQFRALPPAHVPPLQASPTVQASPSLQTPLTAVCTQPFFGSQLSVVQASPSSQLVALPWPQPLGSRQTVPAVHRSPSSQDCPATTLKAQPVLGSQEAAVQGF